MISEYATEFLGKKIVEFGLDSELADPKTIATRLSTGYDDPDDDLVNKVSHLLQDPLAAQLEALVFGPWLSEMFDAAPNGIVDVLVAASPQLPSLRGLFWGDITYMDCEISWINQSDLSPFFEAFPQLEEFRIRGSEGLSLGEISHDRLETLIIESGGLDASVVRQVANAELPLLKHLEVYFGDDNYGATAELEDAKALMSKTTFPNLKRLAIRNCMFTDDLAKAILDSDILPQLEAVDFSLGTLGDEGANALLSSPDKLKHLHELDLHHHYIPEATSQRFSELGIKVNLAESQGDIDADERYVSVGE